MNEMEITATRTPEIIAGEIRTFTASLLNNVIEIGRRMVEVKKILPYGTFGKWITENTGYSSSTADNFMRLFQEYGADQGCLFGAEVDCQTFGKLSYSKALALLSVPKEAREEVALELDAEHLSTRELKKALQERDEARKQLQDASARLEQTKQTLAGAREHETELQRKLADAREDLKTAQRAQAEADELRRKLRTAESGAGEVAMLARMAQTNFGAAMDKIEAMKVGHPETAEKMLTGMERIVEALSERIKEAKG